MIFIQSISNPNNTDPSRSVDFVKDDIKDKNYLKETENSEGTSKADDKSYC